MNVSVYHNYSIGITTYRITTRLTSVEYHNHILVESSDVTREKGGGWWSLLREIHSGVCHKQFHCIGYLHYSRGKNLS